MIRLSTSRRARAIVALASLAIAAGCGGGGGRRPPALPGEAPSTTPVVPPTAVQQLYESGRYQEVLNRASVGGADPSTLWFAGHSSLRLGQPEAAATQFAQLREAGGTPAWQAVSDLALALLRNAPEELDRARDAAAAFPGDPFVQYQLGLAHVRRNDLAAAAEAFDRCTQANPRFAYAYYSGGLAYDRLNRHDLAIARLEVFDRLAPEAPEHPEVASILQTVRNR